MCVICIARKLADDTIEQSAKGIENATIAAMNFPVGKGDVYGERLINSAIEFIMLLMLTFGKELDDDTSEDDFRKIHRKHFSEIIKDKKNELQAETDNFVDVLRKKLRTVPDEELPPHLRSIVMKLRQEGAEVTVKDLFSIFEDKDDNPFENMSNEHFQ